MSKKGKKKHVSQSQKTVSSEEQISAKKAAVLGTDKKKSNLSLIAGAVCLLVLAGGAVAYRSIQNENTSTTIAETSVQSQTSSQAAEDASDVIMYPTVQFAGGVAQHFQYQAGDITITYFILKSSDGIIRAAFDACDVCWPSGKGYYQDGDVMVCRNCGRRFPSTKINEVKGGCNPAPLNRTVKDGQVIIEVKDILEGKQYFDFSQT